MAAPNMIKCPYCNNNIVSTSTKCLYCKRDLPMTYTYSRQPQQMYSQPYNQQPQQYVQQPNYNQNYNQNSVLIHCPACGNFMSPLAENCPYCGNPRPRKKADPTLLDIIAVLAIFCCLIAYASGYWVFSYAVMLVLLIIYWAYYSGIKDKPDIDASKVKQSLNVITILFIVMFCIGFVVII